MFPSAADVLLSWQYAYANLNLTSLLSLCLLNLSLSLLLLSLSCLAVLSLLAIPPYHTHAPQQQVPLCVGNCHTLNQSVVYVFCWGNSQTRNARTTTAPSVSLSMFYWKFSDMWHSYIDYWLVWSLLRLVPIRNFKNFIAPECKGLELIWRHFWAKPMLSCCHKVQCKCLAGF